MRQICGNKPGKLFGESGGMIKIGPNMTMMADQGFAREFGYLSSSECCRQVLSNSVKVSVKRLLTL